MVGADYFLGARDPNIVNAYLENYWAQGGLVQLSEHMDNPVTGGNAWDTTAVNPAEMISRGTTENHQLHDELDTIASHLQVLEDAGVVVLFRPFHEMNGDWFWWGAWKPAQFRALWREAFNYLTYTKGLDNLLWVYSPSAGTRGRAYYPGSKYVDIVGLDIYADLEPGCSAAPGWVDIASLGKPSAITEFGAYPPDESDSTQVYNWNNFLACVKTAYPQAVYFMAWSGGWALDYAGDTNAHTMLADPYIADLAALPKRPGGSPPPSVSTTPFPASTTPPG